MHDGHQRTRALARTSSPPVGGETTLTQLPRALRARTLACPTGSQSPPVRDARGPHGQAAQPRPSGAPGIDPEHQAAARTSPVCSPRSPSPTAQPRTATGGAARPGERRRLRRPRLTRQPGGHRDRPMSTSLSRSAPARVSHPPAAVAMSLRLRDRCHLTHARQRPAAPLGIDAGVSATEADTLAQDEEQAPVLATAGLLQWAPHGDQRSRVHGPYERRVMPILRARLRRSAGDLGNLSA
jgi:hypothetical protein